MCSIYKNLNAFYLEHNKSIKTQYNKKCQSCSQPPPPSVTNHGATPNPLPPLWALHNLWMAPYMDYDLELTAARTARPGGSPRCPWPPRSPPSCSKSNDNLELTAPGSARPGPGRPGRPGPGPGPGPGRPGPGPGPGGSPRCPRWPRCPRSPGPGLAKISRNTYAPKKISELGTKPVKIIENSGFSKIFRLCLN